MNIVSYTNVTLVFGGVGTSWTSATWLIIPAQVRTVFLQSCTLRTIERLVQLEEIVNSILPDLFAGGRPQRVLGWKMNLT